MWAWGAERKALAGKTGLGPGTWMRSGNCVDICGEICSILDEVHIGAMGNWWGPWVNSWKPGWRAGESCQAEKWLYEGDKENLLFIHRILINFLLPQVLSWGLWTVPLLAVWESAQGTKGLLGMGTEPFQCLLGHWCTEAKCCCCSGRTGGRINRIASSRTVSRTLFSLIVLAAMKLYLVFWRAPEICAIWTLDILIMMDSLK